MHHMSAGEMWPPRRWVIGLVVYIAVVAISQLSWLPGADGDGFFVDLLEAAIAVAILAGVVLIVGYALYRVARVIGR
jgi:hypothetical protein